MRIGDQTALRFERDSRGLETARHLPGGTLLKQLFDESGKLTQQQLTLRKGLTGGAFNIPDTSGSSGISRVFNYDASAHVTQIVDQFWGTTSFEYDPAGRLLSAATDRKNAEHFQYDEADNLVQSKIGEHANTPFKYAKGHRLLDCGNTEYKYDHDGRLVEKRLPIGSDNPGVWAYSWNALDQLVQLNTADGSVWNYEYDALGRRIRKRGPAADTTFVWDGARMVHELPAGDKKPITWIHEQFGFAPLLTVQNDQTFSVICDAIGTPSEVVDGTGRVVSRYKHSSYGLRTEDTGTNVQMPIRFQGQYHDDESGLHYNYFRYYDPSTARYIQQDLIRQFGFENLYAYPRNPVSLIDPFGLNAVCPIPGRVQSRINVANGRTRTTPLRPATGQPVSAGFQHVLDGHFGVPVTNSRSVFTIPPEQLKTILQSPTVVNAPVTSIPGGQFVRTVDTGQTVGTSSLKEGGVPTSSVRVITDGAGNLITTFPVA